MTENEYKKAFDEHFNHEECYEVHDAEDDIINFAVKIAAARIKLIDKLIEKYSRDVNFTNNDFVKDLKRLADT